MSAAIIIKPGEITRGLVPLASPEQPEPEASSAFSSYGPYGRPEPGYIEAAFGLHNDVVNAIDYLARPVFKPDPNYSVLDDPRIKGTRFEFDHLNNFVGVRSGAEAGAVMERINREEQLQQVYARSGFMGGVAGLAAGVLSPTMLIPVGGWLGTAARASRVLRAGEMAAAAGAAVGIQEGVLQTAQETRSGSETAFAVSAAVLLGGVLGAASKGMSKSVFDVHAAMVDDHFATPSSGGAAAISEARGSGEQVGSLRVGETLKKLTPGSRTQYSEMDATRDAARDLIRGNALEENAIGIASSEGGSVEARLGAIMGRVNDVAETNRSLYSRYFFGAVKSFAPTRAALSRLGAAEGKMSYRQFREAISDAALAGDRHAVPEVQEAALYRRVHLVDPLRDEGMNVIKGFRELVEAGSADQGYLTRMWNRVAVKAKFNELVDILTAHFGEQQAIALEHISELERRTGADEWAFEFTQLTRQELEETAKDTINNILGQAPGRMFMPGDLIAMKRGPLAERMLASLPTTKVLQFVERDIEKIDHFYTKTMAADINLTKKFGSVDMVDQMQKITDEANAKKAGKSEAEQTRLQNVAEKDKRDIAAMRDILRGTYRLPDNPDGLLYRGAQVAKTMNFLSSLGMMTVSSISDIGKPVFVHGLARSLKAAFVPFTVGMRGIKLASKDAKFFGVGTDMIAGDRILEFNEIADRYANGTMIERGLQQAGRGFGFITLMNPWNAVMKQFAGSLTITRTLEAVEAAAKGTLSVKERAYLAAGGVDANLADRIFAEYEKHGGSDGVVRWANAKEWKDTYARDALGALVNRDVNRIIVTPGVGDKPLWMRTETGAIIGQFQSFAMASVQHTLVAGLQQRDGEAFNGMMVMLALGALSYKIKSDLGGFETPDPTTPGGAAVWASEALDNSGVLGVLMNADHAIEKVTEDRIGLSALTGRPARRYMNVNKVGAFLGPSLGKASDILDVVGSVFRGNVTASDVHKARKMIPLQNVAWARGMFDAVENAFNNAFGIPPRQ